MPTANSFTRTLIIVPDRPLSASIFAFAAPLLDELGTRRDPDAMRRVLGMAIQIWNLHVMAGPVWGKPAGLRAARAKLEARRAEPAARRVFEILGEQRAHFRDDPRRVGMWSFEASASCPGEYDLLCETLLPRGCEPLVPPPIELRVGIGGRWLDEIAIRVADGSHLGFPVPEHRARIDDDGAVTVHTRAMTAVQLFAMGLLSPIGGPPVELQVQGRTLVAMLLAEIRAVALIGDDRIVLRFERAGASREPRHG